MDADGRRWSGIGFVGRGVILERRRNSFLRSNQLGNPLHRLCHIDVVDGHAIPRRLYHAASMPRVLKPEIVRLN